MAPPKVDSEYLDQIKGARQELDEVISGNKRYYAPLMLRLALHDAGIYHFPTVTESYLIKGGPNGSIRTKRELEHHLNKDLGKVVEFCEGVKKKKEKITYADLYQLAGVAAVQGTGGPKIEFVPGREDSEVGLLQEVQLPAGKGLDESQLEEITKRMGLEEEDMVALLGGLHQWKLPVESSADTGQAKDDIKFDNSYFRDLRKKDSNNLLLKGERFPKWVDTYEQNMKAFWKDYGAAHKKVSERGMSRATAGQDGRGGTQTDQKSSASPSWNRGRLVQGIGIAVVTTAIILGFFLSRRSK